MGNLSLGILLFYISFGFGIIRILDGLWTKSFGSFLGFSVDWSFYGMRCPLSLGESYTSEASSLSATVGRGACFFGVLMKLFDYFSYLIVDIAYLGNGAGNKFAPFFCYFNGDGKRLAPAAF